MVLAVVIDGVVVTWSCAVVLKRILICFVEGGSGGTCKIHGGFKRNMCSETAIF